MLSAYPCRSRSHPRKFDLCSGVLLSYVICALGSSYPQWRQPWANLIAEPIRPERSKHWPNTPKNTVWQNWDLMFVMNSSMTPLDDWGIPKCPWKLAKTEWPRKHVTLQISRLYHLRFCVSMFDRQPCLLGLETPVLHSGQSPVLMWHSLLASEPGCSLIFKDRNYDTLSYLDGRKPAVPVVVSWVTPTK